MDTTPPTEKKGFNFGLSRDDKALKSKGVWRDFEGCRLLIRSTDSPEYRRSMKKFASKENPTKLRRNAESIHNVSLETMADALLIDWEDVLDDGQPVECNYKNRLAILSGYAPMREFIAEEAQLAENWTREGESADAKDFPAAD